jgi:hypothetical protein
MSSIVVQSYMNLPKHTSNDVPFSWRIKDYLEEVWIQAQYITDAEGEATQDELVWMQRGELAFFLREPP